MEPLEPRDVPAPIAWVCDNGDWATTSCWDLDRLPIAGDDVQIDRPGMVTVTHSTGASTVGTLTSQEALVLSGGSLRISAMAALNGPFSFSGGLLGGMGTVTLNDAFTWTGGDLGSAGATSFRVIANGATSLGGAGTKRIFDARFENHGTVTAASSVTVLLFVQTRLVNAPEGTWRVEPGAVLQLAGQGLPFGPLFRNDGFLHVRGEFVVSNQMLFLSDGYAEVEGTLRSSLGATLSTGNYFLAGGSVQGLDGLADVHYVWGTGMVGFSADVVFIRGTVAVTGEVRFGPALGIQIPGGAVLANGPVTFTGVGRLDMNGGYLFAPELTIPPSTGVFLTGGGGIQTEGGDFVTSGTVSVASEGFIYAGGSYIQRGGTLPTTTLNQGYVIAQNNVVIQNGTLLGSGTIVGSLNNFSRVQVGTTQSIGQLVVTGPYVQDASAELVLKLGGSTYGNYDQLYVLGEARLGGLLRVTLYRDFEPNPPDRFALVTSATLNGSRFDTLDLPALGGGRVLDPVYDATSLTLNTIQTAPRPDGPDLGGGALVDRAGWVPDLIRLLQENARRDLPERGIRAT